MVQQNIVSYILTQLRQGKKLEDINKFLIESGYDKADVESAVQYVINIQTNPKVAEEQRIQQLADYIQKQLSAGFETQTIANFLISRGYPYYEVNSALHQATMPKKEIKLSRRILVVAVIAMLIMTIAGSIMYFKAYMLIGVGMPEKLLDVETEKLTTIVQQGGELRFQVGIVNFGYEKRFDVKLNYRIIDRETDTVLLEKFETVALATTLENIAKFDIPEDIKPGRYVLRVDATYKEYTATSGFVFDILPKEIAEERLEEIREMLPELEENITEIPELAPFPVPEIPVPEEALAVPTPIPAPPPEAMFYEGKTRKQAFEMVKAVSVREPQRAVEMCKMFKYTGNTEQCLIMIAEFKQQGGYCEEIEKDLMKDQCYIQLVQKTGNAEFCNNVKMPQLQSSCAMMAQISEIQKAGEAGDQQKLFDLMVSVQQ